LIKVYFTDSSEFGAWDEYVKKHAEATPYHLSSWNISINNAYNHDVYYLVAKRLNKICGILPLCYIKPPLVSGTLCASPYCDLGGILYDDIEIRQILLSNAIDFIHDFGKVNLVIRERGYEYVRPQQANDLLGKKVSMLLRLPHSSEALFLNFKSKLRSQIRKAEKNGLIFKIGNEDKALLLFHEIFTRNMKQLGSPAHSFEWFRQLRDNFADNLLVGLVYSNNLAIGTGILLKVNDKCFIPWASTIKSFNSLAPNMLLYWNFLKFACESKCTLFDFGRSTYGEGTYKFKKQWGAEAVPLIWTVYEPSGSFVVENTSAGKFRYIAENAWRYLPFFVANGIAPHIRKYISL
jgi:FemAB-related protein (PEP-CTERM system-associated)